MLFIIKMRQLPQSIRVPRASVNLAKTDVKEKRFAFSACGVSLPSNISPAGKSRNVTISETAIPALIIQPKVLTGRISHNSSEPNPAIVVRAAYRHGVSIKRTVSRTSWRCSASGSRFASPL